MPNCSQNCDALAEQIMLKVDPDKFAKTRQKYLNVIDRKGVLGYDWESKNGNLVEIYTVSQPSYETHNYFKYRRMYESDSKFRVSDVDDGKVKVEYRCDLLVSGGRCMNCGEVSCRNMSNLSNKQVYDTRSGTWVCAKLV